jgi:hypothetical protein
LTRRFSLKYSWSPLPRSFFGPCIMSSFRGVQLEYSHHEKECYAQKNRSAQ